MKTQTYDPALHVIVPRDATHHMVDKGASLCEKDPSIIRYGKDHELYLRYKAMTAAAPQIELPQPPVSPEAAQAALDDIFGPTIKGDFSAQEKMIKLANKICIHGDTIHAVLQAAAQGGK